MDFRKLLVENIKENIKINLKKYDLYSKGYLRIFNHISMGNYSLSIQASSFHYCCPKNTFEDLDLYESMELAIINSKDEFVNIAEDTFFNDFTGLNVFNECYSCGVYAYVPVEDIQKLYDYIEKKSS